MLMDSDSGLNLILGFDNSLQKVVTRTMLNHEEIFRNQVLELHRLYEIQKTIMKDDPKLNCGESPHSFVGPFSEKLKDEPLSMEMKLREVQTICSLGSVQDHSLKEHRGTFEHQKISLDLKLAGNQYTNDSGHLLYDCINPKSSALMKHGIYDDKESSIDVLKLSLRACGDTWERGSGKRTCKDKIICSPSLQAIHLQGSTYGGNYITSLACGYATHSGAKNEFEVSCSFRGKNDSSDWIPESQSFGDSRANVPERKLFCQGVERCHEDLSCNSLLAKRTLFTSPEVGELDLNMSLPDESSLHPIDPWIFNASPCTSSGVSHNGVGVNGKDFISTVFKSRQPKNNCSAESSALDEQDTTMSTLTISPSKDTSQHLGKSTLCSVDFGSVCGSHSDFKSGSKTFRLENAESETHFPDKACLRISELNVQKKKEDNLCSHYSSQELLESTESNPSPVSWKSDLITDDESGNKKTGHCLVDMPNSESSLVSKKSVMPPSEMKSESCNPEKKESTEVDVTVKKGAVSLIYFSLECLDTERNERCNIKREVPEISSESYESIVLKQQDSSVDEYCVSSTPFEATRMDKKDNGVKLKRGRRMKDFRKDILPSLASLSRQEINEDIKVMELALRSREYKKYRSKTSAKRHCISSVTTSRRSRLRSVTPRCYS